MTEQPNQSLLAVKSEKGYGADDRMHFTIGGMASRPAYTFTVCIIQSRRVKRFEDSQRKNPEILKFGLDNDDIYDIMVV